MICCQWRLSRLSNEDKKPTLEHGVFSADMQVYRPCNVWRHAKQRRAVSHIPLQSVLSAFTLPTGALGNNMHFGLSLVAFLTTGALAGKIRFAFDDKLCVSISSPNTATSALALAECTGNNTSQNFADPAFSRLHIRTSSLKNKCFSTLRSTYATSPEGRSVGVATCRTQIRRGLGISPITDQSFDIVRAGSHVALRWRGVEETEHNATRFCVQAWGTAREGASLELQKCNVDVREQMFRLSEYAIQEEKRRLPVMKKKVLMEVDDR